MTPFVYANETIFCLVLCAYLLAAFICVVCFAMSVSYKLKLYYVLPELVVSAISIVLFCYLLDGIRIRYLGADPALLVDSPCFMPIWSVISIAIVLLSFGVLTLVFVVKKRVSSLTAMSVKDAISELSSGLCFYDETGRVLILNEQIEAECKEITGESLYDGKAFWASLLNGTASGDTTVTRNDETVIVERSDGRATCYKRITHDYDGKNVYELSGTDVSKELTLKKQIEQKNANLRKLNERLRKYGEIVAEVTKDKEILAARVKVHNNLGSLILRTKKALTNNEFDRKTLIAEWNDVTSLIFASDAEDKFSDAERTASDLGVRIFYEGKRPLSDSVAKKVFATAVFECVVNTARHADGTELYVNMTENERAYIITLNNNGKQPEKEIKEGGGLSSLRIMTENANGEMTVISKPKFSLTISIPKEVKTNER